MLVFFCDQPVDNRLVLFEEFIYLPAEEDSAEGKRYATGRKVWLQPGVEIELKRLMPTYNYDQWPADHVRIEYNDQGLGIHPLSKGNYICNEVRVYQSYWSATRGLRKVYAGSMRNPI